ncbi:MAG: class II fructose-bisphosphate aldolase [Actinobacteria bacterium]|nr:class II fructose-bisphosphate aldolase [Actinomycetota bacterium]
MLVTSAEIVHPAAAADRGAGAFNVIQVELAEALSRGASAVGAPVILQISENAVKYHGALAPIGLATINIAENSDQPVAVHLDHAESVPLIHEAVALGFTSVMYDGSKLDFADNVATTREVVQFCHDHGVSVEAEIGEVGGKDGVHAPGVKTDPQDAAKFAEDTGVDALAVAVGSSHAMTTRTAELDFDRVAAIREAVSVPLVLHGSSGVADENLTRAIEAGMTKVNISTHLNHAFTDTVREVLAAHPEMVDTRKYLGPARDAVQAEVSRLLGVLNAIP